MSKSSFSRERSSDQTKDNARSLTSRNDKNEQLSNTSTDRKRERKSHDKKKKKSHAVTSWGKYGVIHESDIRNKQQEFNLWLLEVKNINFETLPAWSERQYFSEFMEDYNTATFPHKKFYDLEKWEKKRVKKLKKIKADISDLPLSDEKTRQAELAQLRKAKKVQELESTLQVIRSDNEKIKAMRDQKMLRARMETMFRMGCIKEAQQLQDKLIDPNDAKSKYFMSFDEEDREAFVTYEI